MEKLSYAVFSDIGGRETNEDCVKLAIEADRALFALADGLGGHGLGAEASLLACKTAVDCFYTAKTIDNRWMEECFRLCQEKILQRQDELGDSEKLRTTLNLLCFADGYVYQAHCGDSRTYSFEGEKMLCRTRDHSVPQMLAFSGEIGEDEIRHHSDRNRLTRALGFRGMKKICELEKPLAWEENQRFLLCTDGFWEPVSEQNMEEAARGADQPGAWLKNMEARLPSLADEPERDNATAIAVWATSGVEPQYIGGAANWIAG